MWSDMRAHGYILADLITARAFAPAGTVARTTSKTSKTTTTTA